MTTVAAGLRGSAVLPVLAGVGLLAGATAAGIGALSLADALTATGLPDPGPVTTYGLPFVRAAGEIAAVLAVGSFLFAAFMLPPQANGVLDAAGYRALRLGTAASGVWAICAAMLVPLTVSDVSGQPLSRPPQSGRHLVGGQPRRHRRGMAVDRVSGRRGHPGQPSGAALVVDSAAAGRRADHPGAAGPDRSFVGRRRARPGDEQPADPPRRRRAVGGWPAGAARPFPTGGRARGFGRPSLLGAGLLVLCRYGGQRGGQRAGAHPAARPGAHRVRLAGDRQAGRAVPARRPRLAAAPHAVSPRCGPTRAPARR